MKNKIIASTLLALSIAFFIACSLSANDNDENSWKQFRGNNRNGTLSIGDSGIEFDYMEAELLWKHQTGSSFSEILISNGHAFTMMSEKMDSTKGSEYIVAYDIENGKEVWRTKVDSMLIDPDGSGEGPRSTPVLDDKAIYGLSTHGNLTALSLHDGKKLWVLNFLEEFDNKPGWIYTTSPMLVEDEIIIEVGGTDSRGFASVNKHTGQTTWVTGDGVPSYSSPSLTTINGQVQIIFANGSMLKSFDKSGKELWSYEMPLQGAIATPLVIDSNKIFVSSGAGCFMIKIENNTISEIFKNRSLRTTFSTACYYREHIYGMSGGTLKCISASDGEARWSEKGFGLGSLSIVGNKIIALTDKGILKIIDASPVMYNEKQSIQAIHGKSWTAPSYANGVIYLRNLTEMASYKLSYE